MVSGSSNIVRVDVIEAEEAIALLNASVDVEVDGDGGSDETAALSRQVVDLLDGLPLAVDLASARIKADVENGEETVIAMRRYVADFQQHQDRLLRSSDFVHNSPNRKTMWTA